MGTLSKTRNTAQGRPKTGAPPARHSEPAHWAARCSRPPPGPMERRRMMELPGAARRKGAPVRRSGWPAKSARSGDGWRGNAPGTREAEVTLSSTLFGTAPGHSGDLNGPLWYGGQPRTNLLPQSPFCGFYPTVQPQRFLKVRVAPASARLFAAVSVLSSASGILAKFHGA